MIQEARIAVFNQLGYTELDLGDGRTGIIIVDLVANFRAESLEDDELLIETQFGELQENSIRHFYRITRIVDKTLIALAEAGLVVFDYKTHKTSKWPKKVIDDLKKWRINSNDNRSDQW